MKGRAERNKPHLMYFSLDYRHRSCGQKAINVIEIDLKKNTKTPAVKNSMNYTYYNIHSHFGINRVLIALHLKTISL